MLQCEAILLEQHINAKNKLKKLSIIRGHQKWPLRVCLLLLTKKLAIQQIDTNNNQQPKLRNAVQGWRETVQTFPLLT